MEKQNNLLRSTLKRLQVQITIRNYPYTFHPLHSNAASHFQVPQFCSRLGYGIDLALRCLTVTLRTQEHHVLESRYIGVQEQLVRRLRNPVLPQHIINQIKSTEEAVFSK